MTRLHPDDIQAIAERVVSLMNAPPPKPEQVFQSDFGKKVLAAKALYSEKKARRAA
jgi:hypothetical protein